MDGWEGHGGGWWQNLKQRKKKTQIVEFRVAMTSKCTHKGPIQGLDRRALTVGAISGSHSQIGGLLWHHYTMVVDLHGRQ